MALVWNESYSFGHNKVDAARRRIFDVANEFSAKKDVSAARYALSSLAEYARTVFPTEESLIFACVGQAGYNSHARDHRILIRHLESLLLTGLHSDKPTKGDFVQQSAALLEMWIFNHFIKEDPKVRPDLIKAAQKIADKAIADKEG